MELKDYARVITTQDLERKYDLGRLVKDRQALELQRDTLTKVENELLSFVDSTTSTLENLQDQVDGNITTWFFSGVPTLSNQPSSEWVSDEIKQRHLGDLYYDQDTGYAYRFTFDIEYSWVKLADSDITEALAIANSAKDTADAKRRVFVVEPTTPYDIGDIWLDNGEMMRCSVARESGAFNSNDWIIATKYTDDTVALDTRAVLDAFKEEVEADYVTNTSLVTTSESIIAQVEGVLSTKASQGEVDVVKTDITELKQTATDLNFSITQINELGVNKVTTSTGFKFDSDGLSISKTGEEMSALVDNTGLYVNRNEENVLTVNNAGVEAENITVRKFLKIGTKFRAEDYSTGIGFFFVGGDE